MGNTNSKPPSNSAHHAREPHANDRLDATPIEHAKRLGIDRNIGRKADQKGSDTRALLRRCVRFGAEQKRLGKRQNVGAIANTFFGM